MFVLWLALQLLVYYIPFVFLLSSRVHATYAAYFHAARMSSQSCAASSGTSGQSSPNHLDGRPSSCNVRSLLSPLLRHLRSMCLLTLVAFQLLWATWFWFAFGWIAVVFGELFDFGEVGCLQSIIEYRVI